MTYDLYIDVLFFINFIMDFLVLSIVKRVFRYRAACYRVMGAAGVGAIWAVLVAACPVMPLWAEAVVTYVGISSLMVWISFAVKNVREMIRAVGALYLVTVMTAGTMEALYQHTRAGYYIEQILRGNNQEAMPFYILLFLAAGTYFGIRYFLDWFLKMRKEKNHLYEVTMHYRGKKKDVTALLDTGNRLYEPVSRRPVHVVTYSAVMEICESVSSVLYIPYESVGKKNGMMPGIFLDEMEIRSGDEVKIIKKPLVAVCREPLSGDGSYQMLLHED